MDLNLIIGCCAGAAAIISAIAIRNWWQREKAARKGRKGEKQVSKVLGSLPHKDYIVLNDIILPAGASRTSQIDHILVSTRGVFVIETKSLSGRIAGNEYGQYWEQHFSSQSRSFYNPLLQNQSHVKVLSRLLREINPEMLISMIVFTEAWRLDIKADNIIKKRKILSDKIIKRTFNPAERVKKRWWNPSQEVILDENKIVMNIADLKNEIKRRKIILSRDTMKEIAQKIESFSIKGKEINQFHKEYAKKASANISREIRQGICPRCGGRLLVKKTKNSEFLGCENYPECKFSCDIDKLRE
ncbi:MAG: NERD domain-containing protein [Muribaculaceae bacterium]|nr:NERD domain-containing protein [Muribaculaceae bacterium]